MLFRSREHLGTTDKVIIANRRALLQAIEAVRAGQPAPGLADQATVQRMQAPQTVDGFAHTGQTDAFWREAVARKRASAPWTS